MTTAQDARSLVLDALLEVAPDVQTEALGPDTHLQEDLDLDSMDFMNFVAGLSERTGLEIPERDYRRLGTIGSCTAYLLDEGGEA
jgi:acyl carrier protein